MSKNFNHLIFIFLISVISACGTISDIEENNSANNAINESNPVINGLTQTPDVKDNIEVAKAGAATSSQNNKIVVGEVEWVFLHEIGQSFKARVDSGANTSSISAKDIQPFEREGKNWVRFTVEHRDAKKTKTIEAPIVRSVSIKQASVSNFQHRLVVSLEISLGEKLNKKAQFTLADRSQMVYPILLGREFLQDVTLIDVGKKFLHPKFKPEIK
jgi:hypothetical protein